MKFVMKWQLPLFELTYWITPWFAKPRLFPQGRPTMPQQRYRPSKKQLTLAVQLKLPF